MNKPSKIQPKHSLTNKTKKTKMVNTSIATTHPYRT
jgi:hypothetical protein